MRASSRSAYADVFQYIDPATATVEQLEGQFRNYTPRGQVGRMVALFRSLCEYTGIMPKGAASLEARTQARGSSSHKPKQPKATPHRGRRAVALSRRTIRPRRHRRLRAVPRIATSIS